MKNNKVKVVLLVIIIIVGLKIIRGRQLDFRPDAGGNNNGGDVTQTPATNSGSDVLTKSFDCTASACPKLIISGESEANLPNGQPSPFRGFADPTIRKEVNSSRLWMAYSWPSMHYLGSQKVAPGVDIHYAHSDDSGNSWQYDGVLWPSAPDTNRGGSGEKGFSDVEVANILPLNTASGSKWYGARLEYFVPEAGGFGGRPSNSFRIQIFQASSVAGLKNASGAILGGNFTASGWGVDVNLATLDRDVRNCQWWNEPALYSEGGTLFLALRCMADQGIDVSKNNIVVFATEPTENIKDWQWRYVGKLAGAKEAEELGAPGLTQIDITKAQDGTLLLITTPDDYKRADGGFIHYGCKAVEIASISNPSLARSASGELKVRASITASDQGKLGPGACAYDPASETGILMVRRDIGSGYFIASMHKTGIRP